MKNIYYLMLAILPMMFASCSSSDDAENLDSTTPVEMVIDVAFPQMGENANSRASVELGDNNLSAGDVCKMKWEKGDSFEVYAKDKNGTEHKMVFKLVNIKDGYNAQFKCEAYYNNCTDYEAYYPCKLTDAELNTKLKEQDLEKPFIYMTDKPSQIGYKYTVNFKNELCVYDINIPVFEPGYQLGGSNGVNTYWVKSLKVYNKTIVLDKGKGMESRTFLFSCKPSDYGDIIILYNCSGIVDGRSSNRISIYYSTYRITNIQKGSLYYLNREISGEPSTIDFFQSLSGFKQSIAL